MFKRIALETSVALGLLLLCCLPCRAQKAIELPAVSFTEGSNAVITTGPQLLTTSKLPVKIVFTFPAPLSAEAAGHLAHLESDSTGGVDYFRTTYSGRIYCGDDVSSAVEFANLAPGELAAFSPVIVPDPADGRIFYELTATVGDWKWEADCGLYSAVVSIMPVEAPELIGMSAGKFPDYFQRTVLLQQGRLKGRSLHRARPSGGSAAASPPTGIDTGEERSEPGQRVVREKPSRRVKKR